MHCPRAALFDVDETLAPSFLPIDAAMTARVLDLLARIPVAIVTGRGRERIGDDFLASVAASPHTERFFLFTNSATQCFMYRDGTWREEYELILTDEERAHIRGVLEEGIGRIDLLREAPHAGDRIIDRKAQIAFTAVGLDATQDVKKAWDPTGKKRFALVNELAPQLPDFDILLGGASTIDITKKGVNKSHAVYWLAERLHCEPRDMFYVGDALYEGGNDNVVIPTGIQHHQVASIAETAEILEELNRVCIKE